MNSIKYEGVIGTYSFIMKDDDVIEVWMDCDSEYPDSFIYVNENSIKNKKDFDYEIMAWYSKNQ
jgi:hypothetical protein